MSLLFMNAPTPPPNQNHVTSHALPTDAPRPGRHVATILRVSRNRQGTRDFGASSTHCPGCSSKSAQSRVQPRAMK